MDTKNMPDSVLAEFITECEEILQRVSGNLQAMEKGSVSIDLLDGMYRDMHTMKGSAFLFGYSQIGTLAHALEASLDPIRRHRLQASAKLIDVSFQSIDLIDRMVKSVQADGTEGDFEESVKKLIPRLVDAASSQFGGELQFGKESFLNLSEKKAEKSLPEEEKVSPHLEEVKEKNVSMPMEKAEAKEETQATVEVPLPQNEEAKTETPVSTSTNLVDGSVRVQVALLDRLMNLVGELVLVRNQVLQYSSTHEELDFLNLSKSLDVVTSDLQGEVMRTRMQPIGNILAKFHRVVRDISRDLKKKMDLTLQGVETELDKTLLEAIKDPLTHIIRNSCDHGVESPEERKAAGKPENGHILVRSFHEGGQVVVEVSDDGRGLDREKLIKRAIEKGLMTQERANKLNDREAFNIIFLPGFSTASQVTNISGRGVGMDVVKTNIEKIGGSVELLSVLGRGTTIRLKIPLTLAIVPAMLIKCGGQRFAIPQIKLVELVRIEDTSSGENIEMLQGRPVFVSEAICCLW